MFIYVRNDSFLQSIDEVIYASHVENAFQIIGEAEHAHFSGDLFKAFQQEVILSEMSLDGSERMLGKILALFHQFFVQMQYV